MARASSRNLLRSASKLAIAAAAASLLTGCGAFSSSAEDGSSIPQLASSPRELTQPEEHDYIGGAAYWGAKYEANKSDISAAIAFARNLRLMGGARQAITVMKDIVVSHPDDSQVLSEYGKALTAAGRASDAVPFLARASQIDGDDWSTLSAYGVALDQVGSHGPARDNYEAALKLSPNNPIIQSNLALSYLLEGKIAQAEPILRQLVARPDATPQMRQNLAMVESLRGNHTAAEQLVRGDLPKSEADNNLTVLNQLSASNAAVEVQPLAAPSSEAPASPASAVAPASTGAPASSLHAAPPAAAAPPAPVMRMAPIADEGVPPGKAIPTKPASTTTETTATSTTTSTTDGTAPAAMTTPAASTATSTKPAKQIITMAPVADDEPTKPAPRKPAAIATTPTKPAPTAAAVTAPAPTTEPTHTTSSESATPSTSETPAPAATAAPTATTPDSAQTSQSSGDPFRRDHEVNVATAR